MINVDATLSYARQALQRGDRATAAALAQSATRMRLSTVFLADALAQICVELGLLNEAADVSRRAIALDSGQLRVWYRLGVVEAQRERLPQAREAFERVVALNPRSPASLSNLGSILQRMNLPDLAIARYREALAIDPNHPETHSNLAASLAVLGRYDEALEHARRAVALKPGFVSPYVHAAFAEADRGRRSAALGWIDKIPAPASRSTAVMLAKAEILVRFEDFEEALQLCNAAIAMEPDLGNAHNCRGTVLSALQRTEEAIDACDRAIALTSSAAPLVQKAACLAQLARKTDALASIETALEREPDSVAALLARASVLDSRLNDADRTKMETLLAHEATPIVDRMQLHFALGECCWQSDDTTAAFTHFKTGNAIKRSLVEYDLDEDIRRMEAVAATFSAGMMAAAPAQASSDLPIFIVGMPRSGTTLVEQMLASHPDVHGCGERPDLGIVVRNCSHAMGQPFPACASDMAPEEYRAAGADYLARMGAPPAGKSRLVDKMPTNGLFAGFIRLALPSARIIHTRRDPLDTCLSCYTKLFTAGQNFTYDLVELGRFYRAHEALMAHWRAVLPSECFLEVDYETLVNDFEKTAREIVAFCGLDWSPACLRFHESTRPVRTASMSQVRRPLYNTSIGRWRSVQTELAPLIEALGLPVPA